MRPVVEFFKRGKRIESEQLTLDQTLDLLGNQEVNGRCMRFKRSPLGNLYRTVDQNEVTPKGMQSFARSTGYDTTFHEVYQRKDGSMHYVDIVAPIGRPKFNGDEWRFGVDSWEPLGEVRYFVPRGN